MWSLKLACSLGLTISAIKWWLTLYFCEYAPRHLNNRWSEYWTSKSPLFRYVCYSDVCYSDPHCSLIRPYSNQGTWRDPEHEADALPQSQVTRVTRGWLEIRWLAKSFGVGITHPNIFSKNQVCANFSKILHDAHFYLHTNAEFCITVTIWILD